MHRRHVPHTVSGRWNGEVFGGVKNPIFPGVSAKVDSKVIGGLMADVRGRWFTSQLSLKDQLWLVAVKGSGIEHLLGRLTST